jgi:DNA-directed RNA polymerase subunit M/transcription elongation factor TFIIS
MKFCEKCGGYMRGTPRGFSCTRCGNTIDAEIVEIKRIEREDLAPVDVVDESKHDRAKVNETCPQCGNPEAFRSLSFVSGEHAGVRQERSMERFTCTKCGYSWSSG